MLKKLILFLFLSLLLQFNNKSAFVFAQETGELAKIEKTISTFYYKFAAKDLDAMLKEVSPNFSMVAEGKTLDYEKHKIYTKGRIDSLTRRFLAFSIDDLKVSKSDIKGDKAYVEIEYVWGGVNPKTFEKKTGHTKRAVTLAKEKGLWKITSVSSLDENKQQVK